MTVLVNKAISEYSSELKSFRKRKFLGHSLQKANVPGMKILEERTAYVSGTPRAGILTIRRTHTNVRLGTLSLSRAQYFLSRGCTFSQKVDDLFSPRRCLYKRL